MTVFAPTWGPLSGTSGSSQFGHSCCKGLGGWNICCIVWSGTYDSDNGFVCAFYGSVKFGNAFFVYISFCNVFSTGICIANVLGVCNVCCGAMCALLRMLILLVDISTPVYATLSALLGFCESRILWRVFVRWQVHIIMFLHGNVMLSIYVLSGWAAWIHADEVWPKEHEHVHPMSCAALWV